MRKFIVSDLHGNGEVYDSIMAFLENVSLTEEVELYINGDLIDRGVDSLRMILDVKERLEGKGHIKIIYLGGNHELMMHKALKKRRPGKNVFFLDDWILNGGHFLEGETELLENGEEILDSLRDFSGTLRIYHLFSETIQKQPILLVHAQAPKEIVMPCPMTIQQNDSKVFHAVWEREDEYGFFGLPIAFGCHKLGKEGYFTIIGHTPVSNTRGFRYNAEERVLNIDGGCAAYATGHFEYDHVPLVEVRDGSLSILVFNHNNEITQGYHFDGAFYKMSEEKINQNRVFLDPLLNGNGEKNKQLIKEFAKDGF